MECMGILRGGMRLEGWRSSHLIKVSFSFFFLFVEGHFFTTIPFFFFFFFLEMLTSVDGPIDKLEDLTVDEM